MTGTADSTCRELGTRNSTLGTRCVMTRIDFADGSHNYFAWDADSKRVAADDSDGHTDFIYRGPDPLSLIMERDGPGQTKATYTLGDGLEAMRRNGTDRFYHFDWLGSTFALTDANEDITDTWRYDAWGNVLVRTGTTQNPHTYVGRLRYYWRPDPVMYLLGVRMYDQRSGRSVRRSSGREPFSAAIYVGGRPTSPSDPLGLPTMGSPESDIWGWPPDCLGVPLLPSWRSCLLSALRPLVGRNDPAMAGSNWCAKILVPPEGIPDPSRWERGERERVRRLRRDFCAIVHCIISAESGGRADLVCPWPGKIEGHQGYDLGLMQIPLRFWCNFCYENEVLPCPCTAVRAGGRIRYEYERGDRNWRALLDPCANIMCGVRLLCMCMFSGEEARGGLPSAPGDLSALNRRCGQGMMWNAIDEPEFLRCMRQYGRPGGIVYPQGR